MYDFANYAFNKAHSVCYAVIAYQTAWFKCYYPREYMAALMTSVLGSSVKISEYIAECRAMGIALLPPDINESNDNFTVVPGGIRFGLEKNLRDAVKRFANQFVVRRASTCRISESIVTVVYRIEHESYLLGVSLVGQQD